MSREFGSYASGYLHTQMEYAAEDLAAGRDATTRVWADLIKAFHPIAYAICSSEACDSGEYDSIMRSIEQMPALKAALAKAEAHVEPYRRVMEEAVRNKVQ